MTVLDASAVLAFLGDEQGRQAVGVELATGSCAIAAVNWSEICQKQRQYELPPAALRALAEVLDIVPVTRAHAELAADLWEKQSTLSIADRICMAVAIERERPALTCDRSWVNVEAPGLQVVLAR